MLLAADLHIHSRFSRATSQHLDFPALHRSGLEKGLDIIGTGDFTHPGWLREIEEQLEPAEQGLFRLKPELARHAEQGLAPACQGRRPRFVLQVEISNIYKHNGRVRKNHNLVLLPSLHAVRNFSERLASIGNLRSDGRPILGLDARDLLEITLDTDPLAFLIPAHIWTPWFSMLGSMSGFDSPNECFRDLADHIFAVETGLSSDPAMNWRVSCLDRLTLVSNSDAHSPAKLGREANLFDIDLGYEPLLCALKSRKGLLGTIEFFPEEGKYHWDGHRKCHVRLEPEETRTLLARCPNCGGPITVGVMSRVLDLADRAPGVRPAGARGFQSFVSLAQIVGDALGCGAASQRTARLTAALLSRIGPELVVLRSAPLEEVHTVAGTLVTEALRRVRAGELTVLAGYDGEFGTVRILRDSERARLQGQSSLVADPHAGDSAPAASRTRNALSRVRNRAGRTAACGPRYPEPHAAAFALASSNHPLAGLHPDQLRIAQTLSGPLLVVAGPGTGKTRTITARIAHQIATGHVRAEQVLAITFTRQAAEEVRNRLQSILPAGAAKGVHVFTFHAFGRWLLEQWDNQAAAVLDDDARTALVRELAGAQMSRAQADRMGEWVSLAKQTPNPRDGLREHPDRLAFYDRYEQALRDTLVLDIDDLVLRAAVRLRSCPDLARAVARRFRSVSVDEYQDINDVQAQMVQLVCPDGSTLCAIGDPNQSIYGFRGAQPTHFLRFREVFAPAIEHSLTTTYRLTRNVLSAARSVLRVGSAPGFEAMRDGPLVEVVSCVSPRSEAEHILIRLESLVGGTSLFAVDSGRGGTAEQSDIGFGDVAVLVRTRAQRAEILEALGRSGVPCRAVGEDEPHDPRSQKVAVMTMHASKGREFEVVFVAGAERGLLPLRIEGLTADAQEERRLLYVAMTRAKRLLVISFAARRVLFGRALPAGRSTLLCRLPKRAIREIDMHPGRPKDRQLLLF